MIAKRWFASIVALLFCAVYLASATLALHRNPMSRGNNDTKLDPKMPYQVKRSKPVQHQVDFSVVVTPPSHCKLLKVWIPVPQSSVAQVISNSQFTTFPMKVKPKIAVEPVYGNRFAYFEFDHPQGAQIIRHRFTAKVWWLNWAMQKSKIKSVQSWPKSFAPFLRPQKVTQGKEFMRVLNSIVPSPKNPGTDMFHVMSWIQNNMKYDHVKASLQASADHAFENRCGHCSDYHGLCETMGRALGYPTRVTYGLSLYPKNSPSHCRVETYLPPYGWVSFDLSETQRLIDRIKTDANLDQKSKKQLMDAARQRYMRGFRENSWLLLTKGTNYQLAPKAIAPVPVVRTAYIEADGQPLPEPDPANATQRRFSWMTVHHYSADREFRLPKDYRTLLPGTN